MGFPPFAQAQVVEKVASAPGAQLILAQRLALLLETTPEIDEGSKIRMLVAPLGMGLISGLLALHRPLPRVLHCQRTDNDQHLLEAALLRRLDQHAADARVHR